MMSQSMRAQIGALILATSGVQLANGFFGTFISLRVALDFAGMTAALILSGYLAGFTIGALYCAGVIERFGHIRSYAAFAGLAVAATAAMPLAMNPLSWLVLRAVIGLGCAGLFVTTESWLNAKVSPAERGRVFSIYMVGTFLALALGQVLIGQVEIEAPAPFNIIVLLFAMALALVSLTRAEPPKIVIAAKLPFGQLERTAPVAAIGATLSGLISGAFYALVPAWMQGKGADQSTIGLVMLAAVLGGLGFQIPVGRLSDRMDRRIVLTMLCLGLVATSIALIYLPRTRPAVFPAAFLFGGFLSTLYPVCVAHAHDRVHGDKVVPVSGRLILLSGLGSVVGPLIGMNFIEQFGVDGVLFLIAAVALVLALIAAVRTLSFAPPPHVERTADILTPQAAIVSQELPDT